MFDLYDIDEMSNLEKLQTIVVCLVLSYFMLSVLAIITDSLGV